MTQDITVEELIDVVAQERFLDFRGYRQSTLSRRIRKRMAQLSLITLNEYKGFGPTIQQLVHSSTRCSLM